MHGSYGSKAILMEVSDSRSGQNGKCSSVTLKGGKGLYCVFQYVLPYLGAPSGALALSRIKCVTCLLVPA